MTDATKSLNVQASEEISAEFEALEARALELYARDQDSALELGKALISVRDALKDIHGAFTAWYRDHELDENRVHYCIRKVEGKIAPPKKRDVTTIETPEPDFVLNKYNLAVARFAPKVNGKYYQACVHVDSDGTLATDGFMLVQVSLPPGQPEIRKHSEGNLSRELLLRAERQREDQCNVTIGEEVTVVATTFGAFQDVTPQGHFPNYQRVIPKAQPITEIFLADNTKGNRGSLSRLIELLSFVREFNSDAHVKLSVHQNGLLWIDCEPNWLGQKLRVGLQLAKAPKPSSPPAPISPEPQSLPPAPEAGDELNDCEQKGEQNEQQ
jgi:hypothetical protein